MRVGPSDSDCRVRIQTANSGAGPMTGVVSVVGKGESHSSGARGEDERKGTVDDVSKSTRRHRNQAREVGLGRKLGGSLLTVRAVAGIQTA